ncbi:hypothetical protein MMC28_010553 [Mycoblastus sanguinarius]|nr:hypothetical protein [Mycoblastus sanguinarius]
MAGLGPNSMGFDRSRPSSSQRTPRVNLPPISAHWPPGSPLPYHTAAPQPSVVSLEGSFPNIASPIPRVNLPTGSAIHTRYPSNNSTPSTSDLEGHLRGMILSNGVPDQQARLPHHGVLQTPSTQQGSSSQVPNPKQRASRRPNQAQRRHQNTQVDGILPSTRSTSGQNPYRTPISQAQTQQVQQAQAPHLGSQPPHLRGQTQPTQPPHLRSLQIARQNLPGVPQQNGVCPSVSPGTRPLDSQAGTNSYVRPPAQNRQLYNSGSNGVLHDQRRRTYGPPSRENIQAQINYLDDLAMHEVPKAAISLEEFEEKQSLRLSLETVCRNTVADHEKRKDPLFAADSVELKCFGSLSTTFATRSSDMDLMLVSPLSKPETSSPQSELPRLIEKALLDLNYGVRLLTRTRVPIIKFCEKPTPELSALLLEERAKWEKERDAPPKPKKIAEEKSSKRPDPTLPQNRPNKAPEPQPLHHDDPSKTVSSTRASPDIDTRGSADTKHQTLNAIETSNQLDDSDCKPLLVSDRAEYIISKPKGSPEVNGLRQDDATENLVMRKARREAKPPPPLGIEGDDPSLLLKSDEERVRLYRLAMQEGWYESAERDIITLFIRRFEMECRRFTLDPGALESARQDLEKLPNVLGRYRAPGAGPEHHLDFPKSGVGIQCDINFSNHLALHNSQLLKCYALCDPRVRKMVLFVKAWSKRRKINTPYHGTLSSYGFVLMVLHYLINVAQPPILPNLQQIRYAFEDEESTKEVSLDGYNIQFFRNEAVISELSRRRLLVPYNPEPLGSLLRGFFHYFAHNGFTSPLGGFQWPQDTLSLRTLGGIIPKQVKGWTGAKTETIELSGPGPQTKEIRQRYLFAIEDPFETEHNVARTVVHKGIIAIRNEFRRAHRLIETAGSNPGKDLEDMFDEGASKDNLQYQAFGPRLRKDFVPMKSGEEKTNGQKVCGDGGVAAVLPDSA